MYWHTPSSPQPASTACSRQLLHALLVNKQMSAMCLAQVHVNAPSFLQVMLI